jgi:hypothetical protein
MSLAHARSNILFSWLACRIGMDPGEWQNRPARHQPRECRNSRPERVSPFGSSALLQQRRVRACFAFCNALRCNALQMENHMALAADRMKAMRERRRARGLRELRLIVPDARSKVVRRRIAKEVAGLDRSRESDALGWIEAVSEFDAR